MDCQVFEEHVADIEQVSDLISDSLNDLKRMLTHEHTGGCTLDNQQTRHLRDFAHPRYSPLAETWLRLKRAASKFEEYIKTTNAV